MPDKPKVAFYWCASCGGCEEAVVDLAEDILGEGGERLLTEMSNAELLRFVALDIKASAGE